MPAGNSRFDLEEPGPRRRRRDLAEQHVIHVDAHILGRRRGSGDEQRPRTSLPPLPSPPLLTSDSIGSCSGATATSVACAGVGNGRDLGRRAGVPASGSSALGRRRRDRPGLPTRRCLGFSAGKPVRRNGSSAAVSFDAPPAGAGSAVDGAAISGLRRHRHPCLFRRGLGSMALFVVGPAPPMPAASASTGGPSVATLALRRRRNLKDRARSIRRVEDHERFLGGFRHQHRDPLLGLGDGLVLRGRADRDSCCPAASGVSSATAQSPVGLATTVARGLAPSITSTVAPGAAGPRHYGVAVRFDPHHVEARHRTAAVSVSAAGGTVSGVDHRGLDIGVGVDRWRWPCRLRSSTCPGSSTCPAGRRLAASCHGRKTRKPACRRLQAPHPVSRAPPQPRPRAPHHRPRRHVIGGGINGYSGLGRRFRRRRSFRGHGNSGGCVRRFVDLGRRRNLRPGRGNRGSRSLRRRCIIDSGLGGCGRFGRWFRRRGGLGGRDVGGGGCGFGRRQVGSGTGVACRRRRRPPRFDPGRPG